MTAVFNSSLSTGRGCRRNHMNQVTPAMLKQQVFASKKLLRNLPAPTSDLPSVSI